MEKEQLKKLFEEGSLLNRNYAGHEQMLMNEGTFVEIVSELLKSAGKNDIKSSEPHLPLGVVSGQVCAHDWIKKYYKDGDYAWQCIKCSEIK